MTTLPTSGFQMLAGVAASAGVAAGRAVICRCDEALVVPRRSITDAESPGEMARFETAITATYGDLLRLETDVRHQSGDAEAAIFAAQRQMLHDPMLRKEIANRCLRGRVNLEAAVSDATEALATAFGKIEDPVFAERAADVRDIGRRLLNRLLVRGDLERRPLPPDVIVVARELLPSLAAELGRIRGLVIERGGTTAHAVILARARGIPTLINVEGATAKIADGDPLVIDALAGRVFVHPPEAVRRDYHRLERDLQARRSALAKLTAVPATTTDGTAITLNANAGNVADAVAAASFNADGIGLYRTEFAFLVHSQFPTEAQQYRIYRAAADHVAPRRMVLRVLDLGSDKLLPYFPLPTEANPSLGQRGTRLLLGHPEILRTQLRAILRLSATHNVALLFPMIGGVDELRAALAAVEDTRAQLRRERQPFAADLQIGAMIETPAAAVMARAIAAETDFLSVGTNDLVQYLLTTDRTSSEMAGYYEPLHPAVLQTLKHIIDAGRAAGKPVSLCGEIAGNPAYTELLLGLGATALSVAPGELLEVKRVIRGLASGDAQRVAERALAAATIADVKAALATGAAARA